VDNSNTEPVAISVWGGACDLAQALWKVKNTRSENETKHFVSKLRVYFIGKQDSSNEWIIDNFPDLWLVLALAESGNSWESTYRGMFLGGDMSITSREWLYANVIGKNALANLYPDKAWTGKPDQNPHGAMKEGDSPAMLFFLENGLNSPDNPHWGGWGGRFADQKTHFFRDSPDSIFDASQKEYISSTLASVYRWREDFQNDFVTRVQWGAAENYSDANHYPVIQLNAPFFSSNHIEVFAKRGEEISFDASLSFDPDGGKLNFEWLIYPEASKLALNNGIELIGADASKVFIQLPDSLRKVEVHLILKVSDESEIPLTAYKRLVIHIN
jgi:hypothetical protein